MAGVRKKLRAAPITCKLPWKEQVCLNKWCKILKSYIAVTVVIFIMTLAGYLRGVDVIGEASLIITNQAQTVRWAGYGLKLSIPWEVLPVGLEQCRLLIKVGLSGQFALPQDTSLVSVVYWLDSKPRCKFSKAITIEIQHCAKPTQSSRLCFVRAKCSQETLPYTFKTLEGGVFTDQTNWGCITLDQFSIIGVIKSAKKFLIGDDQKVDEDPYYHAGLYYVDSTFTYRRVYFTVTKSLEACIV